MKKKIFLWGGIVITCLAVIYVGLALYFQTHFAFQTRINHVNAGGCSIEKVEEKLRTEMKSYVLTIETLDGTTETILGKDIGIEPMFANELEQLLDEQNGFAWPYYLINGQELESEAVVSYDEAECLKQVQKLAFMNEENWIHSENAYISEFSEKGYEIIEEKQGTQIDAEKLYPALDDAISNLAERLVLEEADCYVKPVITSSDETLNKSLDKMNRYVGATIVYSAGDIEEQLDKERIHTWLSVKKNGSVKIDRKAIAEYVTEIARKYNTVFRKRMLESSYGKTVEIIGGDYGWKVDKEAELDMIIKDLKAGEYVEREPVYAQTANSHGEHDYGDTYVEINLTAQHLFFYKEGELIVDTDFVSGNISKNHITPVGAYSVTYKQQEATLRGPDYESDVSYWMPYCGDVGMHDATWRSSFGGSIYKRNGSHGCINLPYSAAKKIFENIEAGYPVLVYELPGTESAKGIAMDAAWAVDQAITMIGTVTLESEPAITGARMAYDALNDAAKYYVTKLDILTAAEATYAQLKADAENQAAATQAMAEAAPVIEQIGNLGKINADSGKKLKQARKAYDALSDMAKAYVTNYADLVNAEEKYKSETES